MKLHKTMPLILAVIFFAMSILIHVIDKPNEYKYFYLGGGFFFLAVCFIIGAIENINIDDK